VTHRRPISRSVVLSLAGLAAACSDPGPGPGALDPLPPLETVPFEQLPPGKFAFSRTVFVPAGGRIFLTATGVYVVDTDARTSVPYDGAPVGATSPDGSRIAYKRHSLTETTFDVYVSDLDRTDEVRAAAFASASEGPPTWTPDGMQIVFPVVTPALEEVYRQSPVQDPGDRTLLATFTPNEEGVWECPALLTNDAPVAISPDGSLTFACGRSISVVSPTGEASVAYAAPAPGSTLSRLFVPFWSPDGQRIAFMEVVTEAAGGRVLRTEVKAVNADGTDLVTLGTIVKPPNTPAGGIAPSLCWSSGGTHVLFTASAPGDGTNLWVVRADGTGLTQVTTALDVVDQKVACLR
jgi:Tol biopolymer transport system component